MEEPRRLGLLVPSSDIVMEADLWRHLPEIATLHVTRMLIESTTVIGEKKMLKEELIPAARRLGSVKPELAIFGCTSAAALHGLDGDSEISRRVAAEVGCHCITVVQAVLEELREVNANRIFLVTPYISEITQRLMNTLEEAGVSVIGAEGLGLYNDLEIGSVQPKDIKDFVLRCVDHSEIPPDSVFISCTTFRALEVAKKLEIDLGLPIITSNRSVLHVILRYLTNGY